MAQLPFIVAAYVVTVAGVGTMLLASWARMRRAERRLESDR